MSVAERVADAWNGFLGRIRHRDAQGLEAGDRHDFGEFSGHRHCLVVTYRRSGEAVPTPVWFGIADERIYFRSEERVGKIKRIRAKFAAADPAFDAIQTVYGMGYRWQAD